MIVSVTIYHTTYHDESNQSSGFDEALSFWINNCPSEEVIGSRQISPVREGDRRVGDGWAMGDGHEQRRITVYCIPLFALVNKEVWERTRT